MRWADALREDDCKVCQVSLVPSLLATPLLLAAANVLIDQMLVPSLVRGIGGAPGARRAGHVIGELETGTVRSPSQPAGVVAAAAAVGSVPDRSSAQAGVSTSISGEGAPRATSVWHRSPVAEAVKRRQELERQRQAAAGHTIDPGIQQAALRRIKVIHSSGL
jgi:hypothetical protein